MKILFITNTRIGDAILSTGILNYLIQKYPHAKLTIACGEVAAPLFECVPNLEKLIPMHKQKYSKHWLDLWCQCIGTYWDMVVDLRKSAMSFCLFRRQAYRHHGGYTGNPHRQYVNAAILGLSAPPPLKLYWNAQQASTAAQLIPPKSKDRIVIAFAPIANWYKKTWPIESFVELTYKIQQRLKGKDIYFVLSCAPNERDKLQPLIAAIPESHCIVLCEGLQLLDVAACFSMCDLFIGNDSGLMHMASAVGIPTIGLFGPSKDKWYGPLGENAYVVRTPEGFNALMALANKEPAKNLMSSLSVNQVYSTVRECIDRLNKESLI